VLHGDTQIAHGGLDSYGSRSLVVGGMAVLAAADKVIEKARPIAAHLLEANVDDLEFTAGRFGVKGTESGLGLGEVAFAVLQSHNMPAGVEPSLDADATLDPETFSFPHGTHLCAIEVDTETGAATIRNYTCVDDVGNVVNPMIVEGQVHGGLTQGISQALFEEAVYDDGGTLVTGSFVDYLVPSAADLPSYSTSRTESPASTNPLGVKGVGEAGTIASTPAVVNAVVDALRPFGISDIAMPCSPHRVWSALQAADGAGSSSGASTPTEKTYGADDADPSHNAQLSEGAGGAGAADQGGLG
jgi:aerobic carbon-monoxide dehydrogenase large subunit